jgi:hypothetical protein
MTSNRNPSHDIARLQKCLIPTGIITVSIIAGNAYYCDVKVLLAVGFALVLWALLVIDCRLIELCIRAEAKQTNNDEQSADR